ncbi:hypothetical protein KP509_22G018600 [Ceratopteris richardii]|uniref:Pentatricopeptide repeat-containing protein n=1 Tax=Ceratopteris richardii TaxID=49495 RepID=A0A8T2S6B6_CERRI|nr:hypothetical protein KP509_22G018600 [Ceratopteris richardii]
MWLEDRRCREEDNLGNKSEAWSMAHVDGGNLHGALRSLETMQKEGMEIKAVNFLCTIKACSNASVLQEGRVLHSSCLEFGLHDAYAIFNHLSNLDVVTSV